MRDRLDIGAGHPAFEGHFPGFPVLPGALLLDEALRQIERGRSLDLLRWRIAGVKFLEAVRPGDELLLDHEQDPAGSIRFTVRAAGRPVMSGSLAADGGGA